MPTWKHAIAALLLLVLGAFVVLNLRSPHDSRAATKIDVETPGNLGPSTARLLELERPRATERLTRIQRELTDLTNDAWAGVYGWDLPDGESARLSIAPNSGFAYFRSAPDGSTDLNHGAVLSAKPTRIQIEPAIDPALNLPRIFGAHELPPLDAELQPVRWGARLYLIGKSEMQAFCNAVNSGREGPTPQFTHRLDLGAKVEPIGLPLVTDAYREWLLEQPVEAELIQVLEPEPAADSKRGRPMTALINAGRATGLRPGMLVWLTEVRGYEEAEVVECHERTAKVTFRLDMAFTRELQVLQVGWIVSTRAPKL